jgi:hypothetical protein
LFSKEQIKVLSTTDWLQVMVYNLAEQSAEKALPHNVHLLVFREVPQLNGGYTAGVPRLSIDNNGNIIVHGGVIDEFFCTGFILLE